MKQILIAVAVAFTSLTACAADKVDAAPQTREVCYDKDRKPVEKGTKGALCKKIRVHKMYDGVKIPPAKK
jgi:hypothetical protein